MEHRPSPGDKPCPHQPSIPTRPHTPEATTSAPTPSPGTGEAGLLLNRTQNQRTGLHSSAGSQGCGWGWGIARHRPAALPGLENHVLAALRTLPDGLGHSREGFLWGHLCSRPEVLGQGLVQPEEMESIHSILKSGAHPARVTHTAFSHKRGRVGHAACSQGGHSRE